MVFSTIINQGVSSEAVEAPQMWGWAIESANILNMLDVSLEGLEVWILPPPTCPQCPMLPRPLGVITEHKITTCR
jgi:hypothetical protein